MGQAVTVMNDSQLTENWNELQTRLEPLIKDAIALLNNHFHMAQRSLEREFSDDHLSNFLIEFHNQIDQLEQAVHRVENGISLQYADLEISVYRFWDILSP